MNYIYVYLIVGVVFMLACWLCVYYSTELDSAERTTLLNAVSVHLVGVALWPLLAMNLLMYVLDVLNEGGDDV